MPGPQGVQPHGLCCVQEVQDTQAWLQRAYTALDEQAAQDGQGCMDRYLLNSALLAQLFSGPGPLPEPLGGQYFSGPRRLVSGCSAAALNTHFAVHAGGSTNVTEMAARLRDPTGASSPEEQHAAGGSAPHKPQDKDAELEVT